MKEYIFRSKTGSFGGQFVIVEAPNEKRARRNFALLNGMGRCPNHTTVVEFPTSNLM
jgi:hypothetical protein